MTRLEKVLKTSLQDVLKMSWRRFQNVLKTSWRRLEDDCARRLADIFARRLEDLLKTSSKYLSKTSWRCLEDILKTSWRRLEDIWQDEYIGLDQDVFWWRMCMVNIFVLIKTSSEDEDERRLQDLYQDDCLLGYIPMLYVTKMTQDKNDSINSCYWQ